MLSFFFILYLFFNLLSSLDGRHVCARKVPSVKPYPQEKSYCIPKHETFLKPCGETYGKTMCRSYRTIYKTIKKIVYKTKEEPKIDFDCCPGWTREVAKQGCPKPVCTPECGERGTCVSPNKCRCSPGWTGRRCKIDVDECLMNNGGCTQICVNLPGTVRCKCNKGYDLLEDGKTCEVCLTCSQEWQDVNLRMQALEQLVVTLSERVHTVEVKSFDQITRTASSSVDNSENEELVKMKEHRILTDSGELQVKFEKEKTKFPTEETNGHDIK